MAKKKPAFPSRPCPNCGEPIHIKSKKHEACGWQADEAAAGNGAATQPAASEGGETTGGYFRRLFRENPKWLKGRSNQEVLDRWLADNPGHSEVPGNIKAHLSNVKSTLRSKKRTRIATRDKAMLANQSAHGVVSDPDVRLRTPGKVSKLEALEQHIDDCLIEARLLGKEELDEVIQLLRRARNSVVWKMGQ